jgi:hypothetical protein
MSWTETTSRTPSRPTGGEPVTPEQLRRAIAGEISLGRNGGPVPLALGNSERAELEQTLERGYLFMGGRRVQLLNAYRLSCEVRCLPRIEVRRGPRFAEIDVECTHSEPLTEAGAAALVHHLLESSCIPKSADADTTGYVYSLGRHGAHSSRIPLDRAEAVATRCVEIIHEDRQQAAGLFAEVCQ